MNFLTIRVIQQHFGTLLRRVESHVTQRQVIRINGEPKEVNSYHHFAAFDSPPPLDVWAVAADGVVKAIRHVAQPITDYVAPLGGQRRIRLPTWHCSGKSSRLTDAGTDSRHRRGSRMGPLSDERPKCLVELGGRPLIERQIAALRRGGVGQIGVVRGYRAEMIDFPGLSYFANKRWAETNLVMSLAAAAPCLRGSVIVSYADIFYRSELRFSAGVFFAIWRVRQ
jgi:hypothetical protein